MRHAFSTGVAAALEKFGAEILSPVFDMEAKTVDNDNYRTVLFTGKHLQLTVMSIRPGHSIGLEQHPDTDQFLRVEAGSGTAKIGDEKNALTSHPIVDGDAFIVPAGKWHDIENTGKTDLKLYALYAPPKHAAGLVQEQAPETDKTARVRFRKKTKEEKAERAAKTVGGSLAASLAAEMGLGAAASPKGKELLPSQIEPVARDWARRMGVEKPVRYAVHPEPAMRPSHLTEHGYHEFLSPLTPHISDFAHETGHMVNAERLPFLQSPAVYRAYSLGVPAALAATAYAGYADNPSYVPAGLHALLQAPRLADEALASTRGLRQLIKDQGLLKGLHSGASLLPAFGSYALAAGLPLAVTAIRRHQDEK